MGASRGDFVKYPRTPHLFGSKGTDDDKHLGQEESERFISHESLIVEEKIHLPRLLESHWLAAVIRAPEA